MIWLVLAALVFIAPVYSAVMYFPFKLKGKSKKYKAGIIGIYALCNLILGFNMIYSMIGFKNVPEGIISNLVLFFAAVYFLISMYGSVFLILRKIIILISSRFSYRKNSILSKIRSGKSINIILYLMIILGIAGYINAGIIKVKTYDISLDKKGERKNYNIVMITDTHMGSGDNKRNIDTICRKVNEIKPDFIFLTGDIIDENTSDENADYILKSFSKMTSKYGVYAVLGNHEGYREGDSAPLFKKYGIKLLQDEVVRKAGINIIGRKDYYDKRMEIKDIVKKNKIKPSDISIALSHEPLDYENMAENNVDLVLSGHTHGIQFPGTYLFLKMENDKVYGLEKYKNMNALVSSGAGEWGLHYTLPSGNEIVQVNLKTK